MSISWNHIRQAAPGAAIESAPHTYTEAASGQVTIHNESNLADLQVLINDVPYGPGDIADINAGDEIKITGTASANYSDVTFALLTISYAGYLPFAVQTVQDPANSVLDPALDNKPETEFYGSYSPSSPQNRLLTIDASDNTAVVTNIASVPSPDPSTVDDGKPYLFTADYVGGKVHRIDPETGITVQSISVAKPYGLGFTPTESPIENVVAHTIVSSPDNNTVYVFDGSDHTLLEEVTTGAYPLGVAGEPSEIDGDYGFWVACSDSDRVEHWYYMNGVSLTRDFYYSLSSGAAPYQIAVDGNGDAWVTCLGPDQVAKCIAGGVDAVEFIDVGPDPWDISLSGTHAYVACADDDAIHIIDLSNNAVTRAPCIVNPTHVEVVGSKLYVGSFNTGEIASYSISNPTVLASATPVPASQRMVEGIVSSFDGLMAYAVNMHNDMPERTALPDQTPEGFLFVSQSNAPTGTVVESNEIVIQGLDLSTGVFVPPSLGLGISPKIIKNDGSGVVSTTADNNDTLRLSVNTPTNASIVPKLVIPVVTNGTLTTWVVSLVPGIKQRVAGWLQGG